MFAVKDLPETQPQKVTRRRPRRAKTAKPTASAAILTFIHGIVPISNKISPH